MNIRAAAKAFERNLPTIDKPSEYALGYSQGEFRRLQLQADFLREPSRDLLLLAGLKPGMRVLDLGCGVGDVSMLAGEIVGSSGSVLGVDRSAESIDVAERRVVEAGQCHWVRFASSELDTFEPEGQFDAVIGRLILMYLPDPAATLRRLSRYVRPGGIVAFQEMAMHTVRAVPDLPLLGHVRSLITSTFERCGFQTDMAGQLYPTYLAAGLPAPETVSSARTEGGHKSLAFDYIAATVRSLLPAMESTGVATKEDVGIDDLSARLRSEALAKRACITMPTMTGAWARLAV